MLVLALAVMTPVACAIRYKNKPARAATPAATVAPFAADPTAEPSGALTGSASATAVAHAPNHAAPPKASSSGAAIVPSAGPSASAPAAAPSDVPAVALSAVPSVAPTVEPSAPAGPSCAELVAMMERRGQDSGGPPVSAQSHQRSIDQCSATKAKAPEQWRVCAECLLEADRAKGDLQRCAPSCAEAEEKAR